MRRPSIAILLLGAGLIGCEPEGPGAVDAGPEAAPPIDGGGGAPDAPAVDAPAVDAPAADAGPALPVPDTPLPAHVRELIQGHVERKDFMGVLLVARDRELLLHEAHGFANHEWQIPHGLDGKFRMGSIAKQYTAAAVLLLEEEGRWRVEDLVKRYLPEAPAAWDRITLHHLLTHTSGIPDFVRDPDYESTIRQPSPPEVTYLRFRDRPLLFPPGDRYEYSNSGYVLLALLIERVTGEPFHDHLRRRVLLPLGLGDTGGDAQRPVLPRRVAGYTHVPGQRGTHRNAAFIDMSLPTGGGSLYSTTSDLLRWNLALFGGQLLAPASLQKMTAPQVTTFAPGYAYGYGLFVRRENGRLRLAGQGGIHGFIAEVAHFPETKVTVVVLSNVGEGLPVAQIGMRLAEWAHGDPPAPFPTIPTAPPPDAGADATTDSTPTPPG